MELKGSFGWSLCLQGRGTVVTGRIEQGTIKTGDDVEVLGLTQVKK